MTARDRAWRCEFAEILINQLHTSSSGAKPVPYRLMPRTSPKASLNAVPRAMALSCMVDSGSQQRNEIGVRICSVMIVNPEISFAFERQ